MHSQKFDAFDTLRESWVSLKYHIRFSRCGRENSGFIVLPLSRLVWENGKYTLQMRRLHCLSKNVLPLYALTSLNCTGNFSLSYKVYTIEIFVIEFPSVRKAKLLQVDTFSVAYFRLESSRELYDLHRRSQRIKFPRTRKYPPNVIRFYFNLRILISRAALESGTLEFYRSSRITRRWLAAIAASFFIESHRYPTKAGLSEINLSRKVTLNSTLTAGGVLLSRAAV